MKIKSIGTIITDGGIPMLLLNAYPNCMTACNEGDDTPLKFNRMPPWDKGELSCYAMVGAEENSPSNIYLTLEDVVMYAERASKERSIQRKYDPVKQLEKFIQTLAFSGHTEKDIDTTLEAARKIKLVGAKESKQLKKVAVEILGRFDNES